MRLIPFKDPSKWEMQIQIDQAIFIFRFRWNAMNEFWVMNIYSSNDVPILTGVKIVQDWDLTGQYSIENLFKGHILCLAILDIANKIQRFDMGRKAELFYYTLEELEEAYNAALQAS